MNMLLCKHDLLAISDSYGLLLFKKGEQYPYNVEYSILYNGYITTVLNGKYPYVLSESDKELFTHVEEEEE